MSTPQDPRARRRQKRKRALENEAWLAKRAAENRKVQERKVSAKKAV